MSDLPDPRETRKRLEMLAKGLQFDLDLLDSIDFGSFALLDVWAGLHDFIGQARQTIINAVNNLDCLKPREGK